MTPTPGHDVLYTTPEGHVWPGKVTVIYSDEVVSLMLFTEDGCVPVREVTRADDSAGSADARGKWCYNPNMMPR